MAMEPQGSPPIESADATTTFRKLVNDTANRVYRRRSPSSSSDGSPLHERKLSPLLKRKELEEGSDNQRKREDSKESERDYGRSRYGKNVDSYRSSDHRSSRGYHRHDDYHRRDKYVGDDDRGYSRSRSKSTYSDHYRQEKEHRSRGHSRDDEKYSRAKSDGLGDKNRDKEREKNLPLEDRAGSGRSFKYGERDTYKDEKIGMDEKNDNRRSSRSHKNDSKSRRDGSGYRPKTDIKPFDGENSMREENKSEDGERYREHHPKKQSEVEKEESSGKKPKLSEDEKRQSSSPKHGEDAPACLTDSDIDAAKVAAMRAAEMVNRNLIGTGLMSADQKKKLLWGNKKAVSAKEESSNRWDNTMFGDRERQEKFNKLMGVKGQVKVESKPDNTEDVEKKREQLQLDLEKQYTAGLRRRDGRTVGLGL